MKHALLLLIILTSFFSQVTVLNAQLTTVESICLDEQELRLANMINNFRLQNDLPAIPLSKSLSFVAKTHAYDLQLNKQDTSICNAHSWSNKGKWKACCYNNYINSSNCMWDKPKELTAYTFRGYEIVFSEEGIVLVDSVFRLIKTSPEASSLLLGIDSHSDKKWLALGVGVSENYISIWLGQRNDIAGKPLLCSEIQNQQTAQAAAVSITASGKAARYYLIYGSFQTQADANEAVKRYKNSGLENVSILRKDGRFRVAIDACDNLKDAMKSKEKYQSLYPEAWIYKE